MKETATERLDLFIKVLLRDYTKTKIAEMIGIDLPMLSRFTKGNKVPGADNLKKITQLGVSINWLLNGKGAVLSNDEYGVRARNIFIDDLRNTKASLGKKEISHSKIIETINKHYGSEEKFCKYLDDNNIKYNKEHLEEFFLGDQSIRLGIEEIFYKTNIYLYINYEDQELLSGIKYVIENIQQYQECYLKTNSRADEILKKIKDIISEY